MSIAACFNVGLINYENVCHAVLISARTVVPCATIVFGMTAY